LRAFLYIILVVWVSTARAEFTLQKAEVAVGSDSKITETVWGRTVAPEGSYDRIQVHRYRKPGKSSHALLYLPGTNQNGEIALTDEDHNLWVYLANRGVDVYTLDYRTHAIPSEGVTDLAFMQQWTLDRFVEDAGLALQFAHKTSPGRKMFVAGFSRGVTYAYGLLSHAPPESVAGLIVLDGSFKQYREDPWTGYEGALRKLTDSGRFASDLAGRRGWNNRHLLMMQTHTDPSGPALNPRYSSIGAQLSETLYNAWGPGALANPKEGVSRVEVLALLLDGYDRYFPNIQNLQGRSLASQKNDPATRVDDAWGSFKVPVIYFGSTGMSAESLLRGIYSASHSGSADVSIHVLENYGHLDVLVGEKARDEVFAPILHWMQENALL
jgi:hypothetical protein